MSGVENKNRRRNVRFFVCYILAELPGLGSTNKYNVQGFVINLYQMLETSLNVFGVQ